MVGWVLLVAIAVLSFVPPSSRPDTGVPHSLEHLALFVPTGLAFALGYAPATCCSFRLIAYAAVVELGQIWVPGRHARLSDLIINVLGLCIGVGLVIISANRRISHLGVEGLESLASGDAEDDRHVCWRLAGSSRGATYDF